MPSFLSDLRRRSKASNKGDTNSHSSSESHDSNSNGHHVDLPQSKSSSTLSSMFGRTPSGNIQTSPVRSQSSDRLNGMTNGNGSSSSKSPTLGPRPGMLSQGSSRYSIAGTLNGNGSPKPTQYTSPLAPRVVSVSEGSWVHQKVLLIYGQIGDVTQPMDGDLTVCHHQDNFPATYWPVSDSHFKALVYLQPGPNRLRLDFVPNTRRGSRENNVTAHSSHFQVNYLPMNSSPPLHLAILVAKDSPRTFDAVPDRIAAEGNNLDTAIRKFRMSAYLWQAFTGEQMNRNGFGRRCFRFDEEWQPGTLTSRDLVTNQMRNEAKIHIITLDQTVDQVRDLNLAQQYGPASQKGDLFGIAMNACKQYFQPRPGQKEYVSCLFLDTHWDKEAGTVRGHAALGGGDDTIKLAIFGSHALQSYPAHIEEVVPAFTDCTKTDTNFVANDCNESGSNWEAANIGIGAHMHETGHLFGCPHQETGVMLRDYVSLNRTFTTREPASTRTGSTGIRLCLPDSECAWHRLDALRFRRHPCFALPTDMSYSGEDSISVWAVDKGTALITASTGVAWIEIFVEGDELCRHWLEYIDVSNGPTSAPRQISLTEQELRTKVGEQHKNKKLSIKIFSMVQGEHPIDDFANFSNKGARVKLPDGRSGCKGSKLGFSQMENTTHQEVILQSAHVKNKLLVAVRVYHGFAVDGLEFCYEDGEKQLFGHVGGKEGGSEFLLDTRRGEQILGFHIRAGLWIDGIQILTTNGRRSEIYGNPTGGSPSTLMPPRGYALAGVYGSCGQWMDGFGLIITR